MSGTGTPSTPGVPSADGVREARERAQAVLDDYADSCRAVTPYLPRSVDERRVALARDVLALAAALAISRHVNAGLTPK